MDVSPLRVGNEAFLVASMIERCPKVMMLRELVTNALEAASAAPEGQRTVRISGLAVDGARKLAIWNSGPGMDAVSLHRMCDIASSIGKTNSLEKNFGMGAKVATLPSNQHGLRYRSCTEGRVHQVIMGKRDGAYGRLMQTGPDGVVADVIDVTDRARADGRSTAEDWTEVVLLGNRPDQDTLADPYDGAPHVGHDWIEHYLHRRFFSLPPGTELLLGEGIHHQQGWNSFVPLGERLDTAFTRHEAVAVDRGVRIHYLYDATDAEHPERTMSQRDGHVADSGAAVIFRGEMYDFRYGYIWRHESPIYGLTFGARNFTVLVELSDGYPVLPDGYREFMRYREGHQAQVETRHFAAQVNRFRPEWLLDLLRDLAPSANHMQSARDEMAALFARLGVKRRWFPSAAIPLEADAFDLPASEATDLLEPPADALAETPAESLPEPPEAEALPEAPAPEEPPVLPPEPPKAEESGTADDDAPEAEDDEYEVPPQIVALRDPADIEERGITTKAARFYPETHQVFINCNYGAVDRIRGELVGAFAAEPDQGRVNELALTSAEQITTRLICRKLALGLSKHGTWNDWEVAHALSNESLSLAAEDYESELPGARRAMQQALDIEATSPTRETLLVAG